MKVTVAVCEGSKGRRTLISGLPHVTCQVGTCPCFSTPPVFPRTTVPACRFRQWHCHYPGCTTRGKCCASCQMQAEGDAPGLVESNVAASPHPQQLKVDPSSRIYSSLIGRTRPGPKGLPLSVRDAQGAFQLHTDPSRTSPEPGIRCLLFEYRESSILEKSAPSKSVPLQSDVARLLLRKLK